jgi:hypothetical protein
MHSSHIMESKRTKLSEDGNAAVPTAKIVVHSGGAKGADSRWAYVLAPREEVEFHIFGFPKFRPRHPKAVTHILTPDEMEEGMEAVRVAARNLNKAVPSSEWGLKYIQRDYHIVKGVDAVLAVGRLEPFTFGDHSLSSVGVEGGTGRTVQMYWDMGGREAWLFDMGDNQWKKFVERESDKAYVWSPVDEAPRLAAFAGKKIACIGSREMTKQGVDNILYFA